MAGGSQSIYKFATRGGGSLNIKDQVSNLGIEYPVYMKMRASGLTSFLNSVLSYASQLFGGQSRFIVLLAFCISLSAQQSP